MALAAALCAASGAARPPSFTPPASRASRRASPASAPCHRRACARAALAQREPAAQPTASAPLDSQEDLYHLFPRLHAPLSLELAAWAPFGLVVAPLRLLVWVSLALLDQPALSDADAPLRFIVHSLLVAVSNHSSLGDFLVLYTQPRRYTHLIHAAVPPVWPQRHRVAFAHATPRAVRRLRTRAPPRPVHLFPEGILSSGAALLRFSRSFATLGAPVSPVALRARAALGISTHTLDSSFAANLWWLCFCPSCEIEATVLPAMTRGEGEAAAAFAERVRVALAQELGVGLAEVGPAEKAAWREAVRKGRGR